MEWIIKQNSTLPVFQFEIAREGRSDFRRSQYILNTEFYISVFDEETKRVRVASQPCYVTTSASTSNPQEIIYYVNYKFSNFETKVAGDYVAQISAINSEGTIVLPLRDKINISILESFSLDYQDYLTDYIISRPCCPVIEPVSPITPVDCNVYIITEDEFNLLTESGDYLISEINECPPDNCEIAILTESGIYILSEFGQYLIEETTEC